MPGVLVADERGLGNTFTTVAAVMLCKLVTEKVIMGLPLSIEWRNTLEEWLNLAQNDFPGIVGDKQECFPLRRQYSVPHCLFEIQSTPLQGHPVLTSGFEPPLVVTNPGVAETFTSVINKMPYGTDLKLINLLHG
jgi:hypothetical protein